MRSGYIFEYLLGVWEGEMNWWRQYFVIEILMKELEDNICVLKVNGVLIKGLFFQPLLYL